MTTNIKLLKSDSQYCIFNTDNFQLFSINQFSYDLISHLLESKDIAKTAEYFQLAESEIKTMLEKIGYGNLDETLTESVQNSDCKVIDRITLHVSNDCNLRCKYCYASGGAYGKSRGLMSIETAEKFVEYCCRNFEQVRHIVFFGGEPFLNYRVIEFVCKRFNDKFNKGEIKTLPYFGAITNGTILTDAVFSIIKKYFSFITVSLDGPREINDVNRVYTSGDGSFDNINKFLKRISSLTDLRINIEATYTKQHIENGYTREMIKDYFLNEFNLNADVVDEIALDNREAAFFSLESPLESPWFDSILKTVINKVHETKCPILRSTFAISTDGGIYPCHMNVGDGMSAVTSIWDSERILSDLILYDKAYALKDNEICHACWAKNICGGCARTSFYDDEKKVYSHTPIKSKCDDFKKIVEKTLIKICEVRKNPELWHALLTRVNNPQN